ncbi:cytochrome c biogenesis protein CcdA [bacterium]|nr:cytochrome c biogenesis protein CcdA [bacterium]
MQELFTTLGHALESTPALALAAAAVWGALSVVLSPCHLASIPLIVGFIDSQGRISTVRAFFISSLFALGILVTIALIGLLTAAGGRMLGNLGPVGGYAVAGLFLLAGLYLLDVFELPLSGPSQVWIRRKGPLAAFLMGAVFGLALGPCTFAFMAPVLGVAFHSASGDLLRGVSLLAAYGAGHCTVIVLAGTFTGALQKYLDWNERSGGALWLRRACGALVILGGVWLIYAA